MESRPRNNDQMGCALRIIDERALTYRRSDGGIVIRVYTRDRREASLLERTLGGSFRIHPVNVVPPMYAWQVSSRQGIIRVLHSILSQAEITSPRTLLFVRTVIENSEVGACE